MQFVFMNNLIRAVAKYIREFQPLQINAKTNTAELPLNSLFFCESDSLII